MYQLTTILYYDQTSPQLQSMSDIFEVNVNDGRAIIPDSYKDGKSIIAVCLGEVDIQNRLGDRQ